MDDIPPKDEAQPPDEQQASAEASDTEQTPTDQDTEPEVSAIKKPVHHRFRSWYVAKKKWTIPATILLFIILLFVIPWTRYQICGLFLENDFSIKVVDSTADKPVSGASVSIGGISAVTDGSGQATLHDVKVGDQTVKVEKKYYQSLSQTFLVPILDQKSVPSVQFVATGRQVKIDLSNLINGQPVSGASIAVADIQSKTDKNGQAVVVLPANSTSEKAQLSAPGYNNANVTVAVSASEIKQNDFKLTPAGKVYFLSKLSGTIDVVKTNLDGTDRETVLAGTGKEDDSHTVLLASRDWQYLALLANRDGTAPALYVINTNDDKLLNMDQGNANFTSIGWYNHYFIYTVARNGYNAWQPNAFSIKSYNADNGQAITLANTNASGTSNADAQYENIWDTLIMGSDVVYSRTWYRYPGYLDVAGKQNVLAAIRPDGSNNRQLKSVDAGTSYIANLRLSKPRELDFGVYSNDGSVATTYFVVDKSSNVSQSSDITDASLSQEPLTYLLSPAGSQTFWTEPRDGKNSLFIGDQDAGSPKQIASLSDYNTYGWYTDQYLLVSKNSSELYIIPASGIKDDSQAIKITDYHKPAEDFYGYGGGYGGL
ncbi:MAG TPA: hypothetical protein VMT23_01775 [Candidatus Binatia bacterium]|nr:hypothetical protein [Candidatus Binatia bacterium]